MKHAISLVAAIAAALAGAAVRAEQPSLSFTDKAWTFAHSGGQVSEIPAYDAKTGTVWIAGIVGVDVLDVATGALVGHIDTSSYGQINSVAIHRGLAALAIESTTRTLPGVVLLYDTRTRQPVTGTSVIPVGALPDMLTFTEDGKKILVANEGTPSTYGQRIGTSLPRAYEPAVNDPAGSVSIIDVRSRSVEKTAGLAGVPETGSDIRKNTGMDFEPEYIAVDPQGRRAYVTLQEANAIGVLNLRSDSFEKVVGLGTKDFGLPGNQLDPLNNGTVNFITPGATDPVVKGFFMPDTIAAYSWRGRSFLVMANEGDFREDEGDRSAASGFGATGAFLNLRVSNTDSVPGTATTVPKLFTAGARSFSIRDANGALVYDSGDLLDKEAAARGIYDDGRSRDKGVEPEGVTLAKVEGRTYAFIGLERTTSGAVAVFDVTNPYAVRFLDMVVTAGDVAPEGLVVFRQRGSLYLVIANETSNTTTLYRLAGCDGDDDDGEDYRDDDRDGGR